MTSLRSLLIGALLAGALPGALATEPPEAAWAAWRAERLAHTTAEDGWLTVVGLYWLKDGPNTLGSARGNDVEVPGLPARAGRFVVAHGKARFMPARGAGVMLGGRPAGSVAIDPADEAHKAEFASGTVRFFVIERGGKLALRVRDTDSRARREFTSLDYFAFDPTWLVDARFEPYDPPHHVPIVNVLGQQIDMLAPGALVFAHDGADWRLDAIDESPDSDELFVMFADATSGRETYGGGRFLYVPRPQGGHVQVDFNRAYSPPCAFTAYATCPLPPAQNRLTVAIRAGERRYMGGH